MDFWEIVSLRMLTKKPSKGFLTLGGYSPIQDFEAVICGYQGFEEVQRVVADRLLSE